MNLLNETNNWELNTPLNNLTVNQRKDALVLLFFLNAYGDHNMAFKQLKKYWIDKLYKLPNPKAKEYSSIKSGRYITSKKMRNIYQMYLVKTE